MNIVWFVIDTLRADHLRCYGYFRETSPTIDRLAQEGVLFRDSYASAIATGPGFTSLFTGLSAIHHKFYITPWNVPNAGNFDDDIPTLPEIIQDHGGYTTAAFDNLINFRSHMKQFVRGFEYYVNVTRTSKWVHHHVVGGQVNQRLLPWIENHRKEQIFLFVHYWDPHLPYNQPQEYRQVFQHQPGNLADLEVKRAAAGYDYVPGWGKVGEIFKGDGEPGGEVTRSIDLYDGEILYTDYLISEVVEAMRKVDILNNTAIVITSDHGEGLGQHGIYGHAGLHEGTVHVPLILWRPGLLPQGKEISGFVQHADVAPTILDLIGVKEIPQMDGQSLLPATRGKADLPEEIYMETGNARAIRRDKWKFIQDVEGTAELYNIESDPMEVINLVVKEQKRAQELSARLQHWVQENLRDGRPDPMLGAGAS